MTRRPNPPGKKKLQIKKPSGRIIFFTAREEKLTKEQREMLLKIVDWAVENRCIVLTTDDDIEVIRHTNGKKYEKVVVWGQMGNVKHLTNFGQNHPAAYDAPRRDLVCVAKSGSFVGVGGGKRIKELSTFASNLSHKVVLK